MTQSGVILGLGVFVSIYMLTDDTAKFEVTTKRADDRVEAKQDATKTFFIVQSPSGISHATIQRTAENWPESILVQMRLHGLENFRLQTEGKKMNVSVSSSSAVVRLWLDENEDSPLDSRSPYWMEIRILDRDGKPTKTIPLQDGYFEMKLPTKFFESNPRSIKLDWIDFYRK
jgi:hypothetical protein